MLEGTRYRITTTDDERARVVVMAIFSNEKGKASRHEIAISQYESARREALVADSPARGGTDKPRILIEHSTGVFMWQRLPSNFAGR